VFFVKQRNTDIGTRCEIQYTFADPIYLDSVFPYGRVLPDTLRLDCGPFFLFKEIRDGKSLWACLQAL